MMTDAEPTCGQELAAGAEIPESIAALMSHVADNMDAHAIWVGVASADAKREHDALVTIAQQCRTFSESGRALAALMRSVGSLPPAPHDPTRLDRDALRHWLQAKIRLQKELAQRLLGHAAQSERACSEI